MPAKAATRSSALNLESSIFENFPSLKLPLFAESVGSEEEEVSSNSNVIGEIGRRTQPPSGSETVLDGAAKISPAQLLQRCRSFGDGDAWSRFDQLVRSASERRIRNFLRAYGFDSSLFEDVLACWYQDLLEKELRPLAGFRGEREIELRCYLRQTVGRYAKRLIRCWKRDWQVRHRIATERLSLFEEGQTTEREIRACLEEQCPSLSEADWRKLERLLGNAEAEDPRDGALSRSALWRLQETLEALIQEKK